MKHTVFALRQHFGLKEFRPPQDVIVTSILQGSNVLVVMPTGGGKSLCYQLPALLMDGVTLVVSPLIALMKDQVDALKAKGIPAAMINSSQRLQEQRVVMSEMESGELKIVYVSPERFRAESFIRSLERTTISMLAIDEAHCISQWGHDFRPDYAKLGKALKALGRPRCAAFTATATPKVRTDILKQLDIEDPKVFVSGFARPNLSFRISQVNKRDDKLIKLKRLINQHHTGIIYCATRKSVEALSDTLRMEDIPHCAYHAGMSKGERDANQEAFISKKVPIAIATSAFGMGIDRSDIRFVCHYEIPGSVEAYYQEAGRAGRDGNSAVCELLFMYSDKRVQEFFIEGANPEVTLIRSVYDFLRSNSNEDNEILMSMDDIIDGMKGRVNPMAVSTAIGHLVRGDYIQRFDVPGKRIRGTRLLQPETLSSQLNLPYTELKEKKQRDVAKLNAVIKMCYAKTCRQSWILRYFGEEVKEDCGRCDACNRKSNARSLNDEESQILRKALSGVARMSREKGQHHYIPKFGRGRIIQMLLGSNNKHIRQSKLDQLSTHGILRELGEPFLKSLFDSMEQAGLIRITTGKYPLTELTDIGVQVMSNEAEVLIEWPTISNKHTTVDPVNADTPTTKPTTLYRELVSLRNRMRKERGNVPAYSIFPNRVIEQLAELRPDSAEKAMSIKGIDPAKAESILPSFLKIIKNHKQN